MLYVHQIMLNECWCWYCFSLSLWLGRRKRCPLMCIYMYWNLNNTVLLCIYLIITAFHLRILIIVFAHAAVTNDLYRVRSQLSWHLNGFCRWGDVCVVYCVLYPETCHSPFWWHAVVMFLVSSAKQIIGLENILSKYVTLSALARRSHHMPNINMHMVNKCKPSSGSICLKNVPENDLTKVLRWIFLDNIVLLSSIFILNQGSLLDIAPLYLPTLPDLLTPPWP